MENKRLIGILFAVAILLFIPFIANAPWNWFDYIVTGVLLLGTGLAFEFAMRMVTKTKHRVAIGAGILAAFLLIWAELAVGLRDTVRRKLKFFHSITF